MMDIAFLDAVRDFNRFYTNRLGLLVKGYLETDYTLTEARVLYEIGAHQRVSVTTLVRELGLDPAYLSRLLKKFRATGFVDAETDPLDRRAQVLHVTDKGQAEYERLGALSRRQLALELESLDEANRVDLIRSMQAIRRLFETDTVAPAVTLRPHRIGDMGWVIEAHALAYARDYGWNEKFEALVAQVCSDFIIRFNPDKEHCWIAERDGHRLGSVFLVDGGAGIAKLRLLYLEPQARGLGLGRRLVEECITFARASGYTTMSLWTNDMLTAAIRIYEALGFRLVAEEKHSMFGPECTGQTWELDLRQ